MGSEFKINIEPKSFIYNNDFQMIKANNKYLFTSSNNSINIYNLSQYFEINFKNSISCNKTVTLLDISPFYPNVISSSLRDGNIKIWEITDSDQDENKEIYLIKTDEEYVKYSLFNPVYENIIISSSDYNNIKLWDTTYYIHLYNISNEGKIDNLQWDTTGEYYGYIKNNNELVIREKDNYKNIIKYKEKINEFPFINNMKILTFSDRIIKCWDMRNIEKAFKTTNIDSTPISKLYDANYNYLYFNRFTPYLSFNIFDINNFNIIYSKDNI